MPLHLQLIFYIGKNILMLYIVNTVLNIYFEPKKQLINRALTYSAYMILGVLSHFLIATAWINVIITTTLVYMLSTNFKCSVKNSIVVACCWQTFTMITEMVVSIIYVSILKQGLEVIVVDNITNLVVTIIHTLILLIIIKSAELYMNKKALSENLNVFDSLYVCVIPVFSIFTLYFFLQLSLIHNVQYSIVIISCLLVIFINIFFFSLFDKIRFSEKLKYENAILKNQAEYFSRLEKNANDTFQRIRTIKHDLKYQLLCLKAKSDEQSLTALEEVRNLLDIMIKDTLSENQIEYTKNKSLNKLLNYKLFVANKNEIEVDIKVSIRDDTFIDEISLYTILGNAIDNATRNFDSSNSYMKNMNIRIVDDYDNLFIRISNPYNKRLKFKNGLPLTDKRNKEQHGIGLQSIKDLVEQKNGHFKITSIDNIFTLEIMLYDEIPK